MTDIILNDYYLEAFVDEEIVGAEATHFWHALLDNPVFRRKHEVLVEQKKLLLLWWDSLTPAEQQGNAGTD